MNLQIPAPEIFRVYTGSMPCILDTVFPLNTESSFSNWLLAYVSRICSFIDKKNCFRSLLLVKIR